MNKNSKIYVAGHTGFIGSAVLATLKNRGYRDKLIDILIVIKLRIIII